MSSIFRRTRLVNGTRQRATVWHVAYVDAQGRRRVKQGYADKQATRQMAQRLERQACRAKEGLGHADPERAATSFSEAQDAYLADLARAGRAPEYVKNVGRFLTKLSQACGWATVAAVQSPQLTAWLSDNAQLSARSQNQYLGAASAFMNWCVRQGYVERNPLAGIVRTQSEPVRHRRALTGAEVGKLLRAAPASRRLFYLCAVSTGLRRGELRDLVWGDLHLGERPRVELRAEATKGRRADVLPIPPECAGALRAARPLVLPGVEQGQKSVFAQVPSIRTFRRDLARAGIEYRDGSGRVADLHSLRKTFGTMLQKAGVPLRTAMALMRHTDARLTTQVYCDVGLLDLEGAVGGLPTFGGVEFKKVSEVA